MTLVYYFVSHEEETLLFSKSDHIFNALSALDLTYHTGQPQFDNTHTQIKMTNFLLNLTHSISIHTGGVSWVDDAEDAGIAVLPGFTEGSPELCNVQTPAITLVQVVVNLHGAQVCQGG